MVNFTAFITFQIDGLLFCRFEANLANLPITNLWQIKLWLGRHILDVLANHIIDVKLFSLFLCKSGRLWLLLNCLLELLRISAISVARLGRRLFLPHCIWVVLWATDTSRWIDIFLSKFWVFWNLPLIVPLLWRSQMIYFISLHSIRCLWLLLRKWFLASFPWP